MLLTTTSDALARATYNALLYCPKTPVLWAMTLVVPSDNGVSFLTCDSYALSWSECPGESKDVVAGAAMKICREDLEALEKRTREDKKQRCTLEFDFESEGIYYTNEESAALFLKDTFDETIDGDDSWDEINLSVFRDLIAQREYDPQTRRVMVAPEYLRKLGQLKKDKGLGADMAFANPSDPVLIKVGDGFRLVVQPIDRERHEEALGEGATW